MKSLIKKYQTHIIWAVVAIIALAGGFFWGKSSGGSTAGGFAASGFSSSTARTRFAGAGGAAAAGLATGQVVSIGSESLTLQLTNGNSEVIFYSSSTAVTEPTTVPVSDLKTGSNVTITGTTNSDGSLTASSIQVRPAGTTGQPGARTASSTAQ